MDGGAAAMDRQAALRVLALATREELAAAFEALPQKPAFETLRRPEIGLVMARGRIGGGGAPFNLGEVTVSRAAVRMAGGAVGFGHVLGRDLARAELVARFDALRQDPAYRDAVDRDLLGPVGARISAEDAATRRKTEATRVNFFTLVRGEDP